MKTETEAYLDALRRIYEATLPPYHSKAARIANHISRDALAEWGKAVAK